VRAGSTGENQGKRVTRDELRALLDQARALQPTNRAKRDTSRDWCRITNKGDEADVYIYDEIGFWGTRASDFADQLAEITSSVINLHINSPGGSVFDGLAIYNALCDHKAEVRVTVDALAASAASFIAQAGDNIRMGRQAMMMIHDASGFTVGNAKDHREMADLLDKLSDAIADIYADRTGFPTAHWRTAMLVETWYSAQEAVDAMLADETTKGSKDDDEQDRLENAARAAVADFDLSVFVYPGREAAPEPPKAKAETDPVSTETGNTDPTDPTESSDPEPADFATWIRQAAEEAIAPPPFELSADSFREATKWANDHAPAVTVPKRPAASGTTDVADADDQTDPSDSIPPDNGEVRFSDQLRAVVEHRAKNAPAVDVPASPRDPQSDPAPLDMQRIILEEAIR
jgi:ATP-dependent protease ClpP protease subunit